MHELHPTPFAAPLLAAFLLAASPPGQADAESAPGEIEFEDDPLSQPEFAFNDARIFRATSTGETVRFEVEMAQPIDAGMFTCFRIWLDTDHDEKTGLDGAELWLRGSVGSRFHPNSWRAPAGSKPPMEILRTTYATVTTVQLPGGGTEKRWLHSNEPLAPPVVSGNKLSLTCPTALIRKFGARYGSVMGIRPQVETSCSEQPLLVRVTCGDEGIPIQLDGDADEWSDARLARDSGDELHESARFVDITSFRVDHAGDRVFACIRMAAEGFADDSAQDRGMDRRDGVSVYFQPLFPRYQSPVEVRLKWGQPQQSGTTEGPEKLAWSAAVRGDTIELGIERRSGQTQFRVFAWSDLHRFDTIGVGQFLQMGWGKK